MRKTELFPYEYSGSVVHWTPDFLLADGTYVEIKGYLTEQAPAKFEYFLRPLTIFREQSSAACLTTCSSATGETSSPSTSKIFAEGCRSSV